jgi:hypothetical protein
MDTAMVRMTAESIHCLLSRYLQGLAINEIVPTIELTRNTMQSLQPRFNTIIMTSNLPKLYRANPYLVITPYPSAKRD